MIDPRSSLRLPHQKGCPREIVEPGWAPCLHSSICCFAFNVRYPRLNSADFDTLLISSRHHFSIPRPMIKGRVENMLSRFDNTIPPDASIDPSIPSLQAPLPHRRKSPSTFLMMSALDVLTLLDTLFQQNPSSLHSSPASAGVHSWPSSPPPSINLRPDSLMDSAFARFKHDTSSKPTSHNGSIFSVETQSILAPENSLSERAARIRFELTDLDHPDRKSVV